MPTIEDKAKALTENIFRISRHFQFKESDLLSTLEIDLSLQEWRLIIFLGREGSSIMREIADHLRLAVSTVTGLVDKLVSKGLVHRERPEEDRRIVRVELTPKGQKLNVWHFEEHTQLSYKMLQNLSETEQDTLIKLIEKIVTVGFTHERRP